MRVIYHLIRAMRPRQWTKNIIFILPGIVFDGQLTKPDAVIHVIAACILLIMMSGSVYIINDLVDVERDRKHPTKRLRPIASGELPRSVAIAAAILIPTATTLLAASFSPGLTIVLLAYLALQIAYSFWLKHIVLIDVLAVAAGFVLRVVAGIVVIEVTNFSPWLYVSAGLLALFLAVGKRRQELIMIGDNAADVRPIFQQYNLALLDDMLRLVTTSTLIVYIIYTVNAPTRKFADTNLALLTIPFVMYGLFRYLYVMHVKGEGSAPEEVLLQDRLLQVAILLWGFIFLLLIYVY